MAPGWKAGGECRVWTARPTPTPRGACPRRSKGPAARRTILPLPRERDGVREMEGRRQFHASRKGPRFPLSLILSRRERESLTALTATDDTLRCPPKFPPKSIVSGGR